MKKFIIAIIVSVIISLGIVELNAQISLGARVFIIKEKILLKNLPKDTSGLRLWIPYPVNDAFQKISDFKIESPYESRLVTDKDYENKIIYLKAKQGALIEDPPEIMLSFKVIRKELKEFAASTSLSINPEQSRRVDNSNSAHKNLSRFLKSDRLVPVNGKIKKIAHQITQGKKNDLERVRAIYDYIIDQLTYSKDDPKVCGIGDSLLTLQHLKGICTDYHSLFISFARSLDIPAKFEIGFRLPEDTEEGKLNGYHCWAKFYLKGKGWIPVDISEADKHPEKRDYFFGNIDENRVHLATGRDITLKGAKDTQPLNFFVYPYVELNGAHFTDVDIELSFRDLKGGDRYEKLLLSEGDKRR